MKIDFNLLTAVIYIYVHTCACYNGHRMETKRLMKEIFLQYDVNSWFENKYENEGQLIFYLFLIYNKRRIFIN